MKDNALTSIKEAIAEEVRAVMARRKVTQRQLSSDLDWSVRALGPRLNGEVEFSAVELVIVCLALGADPADVMSAAVGAATSAAAA